MLLRHRTIATLVAVGAALALPAAAHAKITEIGALPSPLPKFPCPGSGSEATGDKVDCLVLSVTTTYQVKVGEKTAFMTVPKDGKIVAWTVALGNPTATEDTFLTKPNSETGGGLGLGDPRAGIAVLRADKKKKLGYRNVTQSPVINLRPYFGKTVQIPLDRALPAKKGRVIALTVPSWAPVMALGQGKTTSYRASRVKTKCGNTDETASDVLLPSMSALGKLSTYECLYQDVRLTYSATLITTPDPAPTTGSPNVGGATEVTPTTAR